MGEIKKSNFWKIYFKEAMPGMMFFFAIFFLIVYINPGFLSLLDSNIYSYMPLAFLAFAEIFVLSVGDVDLSVGAGLTLVNVITVHTYVNYGVDSYLLLLVPLAVGLGIGFVNGVIVAYLRLNAFLATIGTTFVWAGSALLIMHQPGGSIPSWYRGVFRGGIFGAPISMYLIVLAVIIWLFFRFHPISNHLYATGDDIKAAFSTGIDSNRMKFYAFLMNGLMIGIAGFVITGAMGSGNPLGEEMALPAILAALIGGATFSGGTGNAIGAIGGALGLGFLERAIYYLGVSSYFRDLAFGILVLVGIVALSYLRKKKIWVWG